MALASFHSSAGPVLHLTSPADCKCAEAAAVCGSATGDPGRAAPARPRWAARSQASASSAPSLCPLPPASASHGQSLSSAFDVCAFTKIHHLTFKCIE